MANYVQQQSIGDVIRNTFAIYGKGFGVISLSYFLPMLPFQIFANEAISAHSTGLYLLVVLCSLPVSLFASAAITVSVSDICLGNAPSLGRSYKKPFAVMLKLLGTNILQVAFILVGYILLVIPGIIASLWLMFTPYVVILEGLGGFSALKRSKELARGYSWRNFGVLMLLVTILLVIGMILGGILALLLPPATHAFQFRLFQVVLNLIMLTIAIIATVLLYYDLRVRKEAYDAAALAEDLRR